MPTNSKLLQLLVSGLPTFTALKTLMHWTELEVKAALPGEAIPLVHAVVGQVERPNILKYEQGVRKVVVPLREVLP